MNPQDDLFEILAQAFDPNQERDYEDEINY
jgi:hypothetical protein